MHYDGLISIAFGLVTVILRKRGAEETLRFWGTPGQKDKGVVPAGELAHAIVGIVFLVFGLIRLLNR
jgi:hypothetical protein